MNKKKGFKITSMRIFSSMVILFIAVYVHNYSVVDAPPLWRNQKQKSLVISQGEYISLQAEAMDDVSLRKAVLSTNETGIWGNETEYPSLWRQEAVFGFDNFGTATYKAGVLYAPSKGDNNVYAIDASTGDMIWNKTVRQCDASPYIDGDVIYVGECSNPYGDPTPYPRALALNRASGEEVWHYIEPNDYTWVGSPLVHGDYVYYTTYGSGIYALNKTNGNSIWHKDIGTTVCSVAYNKGLVFVSAYNPAGQYAFNATTGDYIWHKNYGASWDASPVIYEGMVIQVVRDIVTNVWDTCVLNETNGELIRRFDGKGSPSTPLVYDDKVFIPDDDWRMWAFHLVTGEELWHTAELHNGILQDYSYCSPAVAGGAIYYQSLNGTFYVINAIDGAVLWFFTMGSYGFGSPSIGDGRVFITNDFALYAFEIGPGSGDWPMFCQNNLHQSNSEHGVEYVRRPLTQPQHFKDSSNTWMTAKFTWCNKTIDYAAIAWRIYFYDSVGNVNMTDIKIFYVNVPIHNVATINVTPFKTVVGQSYALSIGVLVENQGSYTETLNVTAYCNDIAIVLPNGKNYTTVTLLGGESTTITFIWSTIGFDKGDYTIKAGASLVPGEVETADNTYTYGTVLVTIPGDVNGDKTVGILDAGKLNAHWTGIGKAYDGNADINNDGNINILDAGIVNGHWNQSW